MKSIINIIVAAGTLLTVLPINAQTENPTRNPEVVRIMDQFDSDIAHITNTIYGKFFNWQIWENDQKRIKDIDISKIKSIVSQLDRLDAEHKFAEVVDSTGFYSAKYTINLRRRNAEQTEFVSFNFNKYNLNFGYSIKEKDSDYDNMKDVITPQSSIDRIDNFIKPYLERKDAECFQVIFDRDYSANLYRFNNGTSLTDKKTMGKRVVIRNSNADDFQTIRDVIRKNTAVDGVSYIEMNERDSKMVSTRLVGKDKHAIIIAVYQQGNTLQILRVTGTRPWACQLPTDWTKGIGDISNDQNPEANEGDITDIVYQPEDINEVPSFPGGQEAMNKYIKEKMIYPPGAAKNSVTGSVIVQFVVLKTGTLADVHVVGNTSSELHNEAVRLVRNMPRWVCGARNGQPVNCQESIKIDFVR